MRSRVPCNVVLVAVFALAVWVSACSTEQGEGAAEPKSSPNAQASEAGTARARDTLRAFFAVWQARDEDAIFRYLPARLQKPEWDFEGLDRVEFGPITASPELVEEYVASGHGGASGVSPEDVRCFQADATFFYLPGCQGSADEGQALQWHWFLERDDMGYWKVTDWGF